MSKIGLVIGREYGSRVKKKSFIIMTILGPLLFAGFMAAAIWVSMADNTNHQVIIVDEQGIITYVDSVSGKLLPSYPQFFEGDENLSYHFKQDLLADSTFNTSDFTLMVDVDKVFKTKAAQLYYKDLPSAMVTTRIERHLEEAIERAKVRESKALDYQTYKELKVNIALTKTDINASPEDSDHDPQALAGIGIVFGIIIFFFVFLYGAMVMRGVIEEKSSRIVEVIVSSIKPFQLMMGKIIGIGLVGLTQFLIWIGFSFFIFMIAGLIFESGSMETVAAIDGMSQGGELPVDFNTFLSQHDELSLILDINWPLMLSMFVVYFIGGYLLYGSLFASIGAAADNETDTQQFMIPVMLPLFFSYMVAIMSINNPEGVAAKIFSFVPFSSPIVMMTRIPLHSTPIWHMALSLLFLFAACFFFVWLAGRIYKTGILMYGKKISYKEIWKWIKFSS